MRDMMDGFSRCQFRLPADPQTRRVDWVLSLEDINK